MTETEKKTAVVTGAASGIGKATVITLLKRGFNVSALDIDSKAVSYTHLTLPTSDLV